MSIFRHWSIESKNVSFFLSVYNESIDNNLPTIIYPHRQDGGVLLFSATAIASLKDAPVMTENVSGSLSQTVTAQRTPPSA